MSQSQRGQGTGGRVVAAIAVLTLMTAGMTVGTSSAAPTDYFRPFAANSPWNVPIPENPRIDARSGAFVSKLMSGNVVALTQSYGNAIFDNVDPSTPRYNIHISKDSRNGGDWGHNAVYGLQVPVPVNAFPPSGTDGTVVILDRVAKKSYYLWQFQRTATGISSTWPAVFDLYGSGSAPDPLKGRGTAAGVDHAAGTIRIEELRRGEIQHAVAFHTFGSFGCAAPGTGGTQNPNGEFRWPAVSTDAHTWMSSDANCIPYGTRVQLDPSINLDTVAGLTRGERIIGRAMQKYGAYLIDKGGASMGFGMEVPEPGDPSYCSLGLAPMGSWACPTAAAQANYHSLKHLMQGRLRALADCVCGTTRLSAPVGTVDGSSGSAPVATPTPTPPASAAPVSTRYVSDLAWSQVSNGWGPVEKDRSNGEAAAGDGRPLTVGGRTYAKGLGVHATGEVRVPSPGACTFSAVVGVDGETGGRGSVVFAVYSGTSKLFDSGRMTGNLTRTVSLPVTAGAVLRLVVTDAADGLAHDHADWADAKFSCQTVVLSSTAPAVPDTTWPSPPGTPVAAGTSAGHVHLTWGAATDNVGVTSYVVWRGDANWANWRIVGTTSAGTRAFTDTTVVRGTKYSYNVRAVDAARNTGHASGTVQITR